MANPAFYTELRRTFESAGPREVFEIFNDPASDRSSFEPGRMLEAIDDHLARQIRSGHVGYEDAVRRFEIARCYESGHTTTGNFLNIASQFSYANVLAGYRQWTDPLLPLIPTYKAQTTEVEKIPGITDYGDEVQVRPEGEEFGYMGVTEDWVLTPTKRDWGRIAALTFESIYNIDSKVGGALVRNQGDVGKALAVNKAKRAWKVFLDRNGPADLEGTRGRYNWRNNGPIATYGDNSGSHSWDNLQGSNALVNWTDLDAANQLFKTMLNPYNGEPTLFIPTHLVVPTSLEWTGRRILSATGVNTGDITSGTGDQTVAGNIVAQMLNLTLLTSPYVDFFNETAGDWFLSNPAEHLVYLEVDPMGIVQAPALSPDEFKRRIVAQWRIADFGDFMTLQPRATVKNTVA